MDETLSTDLQEPREADHGLSKEDQIRQHWKDPEVVSSLRVPSRTFELFSNRFENALVGSRNVKEIGPRQEQLALMLASDDTKLGDLRELYEQWCVENAQGSDGAPETST